MARASRTTSILPVLSHAGELYKFHQGAIAKLVTRDGEHYRQLCNFSATIDRVLVVSDGDGDSLILELSGSLTTGQPLPVVRVDGAAYRSMNWVDVWPLANIYAGHGGRDAVRDAIQRLSHPAQVKVYGHLGWAQIDDGGWVYLHSCGAIGAVGVVESLEQVQPSGCPTYRLPEPPQNVDDVQQAANNLLEVLSVGKLSVTLPGLLFALGSVFGNPQFALFFLGRTGTLKTAFASVLQRMVGWSESGDAPLGFTSTPNYAELVAHAARDTLLVVDDFAPQPTRAAREQQDQVAERVIRAVGNGSGRGSLNSDRTSKRPTHPRGAVLATGETMPTGHSLAARLLVLPFDGDTIDPSRLASAQQLARGGQLAAGFSLWVQWLAQDLAACRKAYEKAREGFLREWSGSGGHLRTPAALAHLWATWGLVRAWLESVDPLWNFWTADLEEKLILIIEELGASQGDLVEKADPVNLFLEGLRECVATGKAFLEDGAGSGTGELVGYRTATETQLLPHSAVRAVADHLGSLGYGLNVASLGRQLADANLIRVWDENGRRRFQLSRAGRPAVWVLAAGVAL